jgi:hypothetical protein
MGTLHSGIKDTGSTLDSYGPINNANLEKFVVTDFGLNDFGENGGEP